MLIRTTVLPKCTSKIDSHVYSMASNHSWIRISKAHRTKSILKFPSKLSFRILYCTKNADTKVSSYSFHFL